MGWKKGHLGDHRTNGKSSDFHDDSQTSGGFIRAGGKCVKSCCSVIKYKISYYGIYAGIPSGCLPCLCMMPDIQILYPQVWISKIWKYIVHTYSTHPAQGHHTHGGVRARSSRQCSLPYLHP